MRRPDLRFIAVRRRRHRAARKWQQCLDVRREFILIDLAEPKAPLVGSLYWPDFEARLRQARVELDSLSTYTPRGIKSDPASYVGTRATFALRDSRRGWSVVAALEFDGRGLLLSCYLQPCRK